MCMYIRVFMYACVSTYDIFSDVHLHMTACMQRHLNTYVHHNDE